MQKILRRSKFGYALSLILCLLGTLALIITFCKAWPKVYSANDFISTFWNFLWTEEFNLFPGVSFKLVFLTIFGVVAIVFGSIVWMFSRRWFHVGEQVLVECPFCKRRWRTDPQKALVHCPFCRQLVHPRIVKD